MSVFDNLIQEIENDLPQGWSWLLRSTNPRDGYFANITAKDRLGFPSYAKTPYEALRNAHVNFLSFLKENPNVDLTTP